MPTSTQENNKRIAKNTLMLYFRMILLMLISLYTSRVNLNALGVEDYGIYNVVGGVVAMFAILSGSLSAAISRFITFELGRGDQQRLSNVFSASVTIQFLLALLIIVLFESIGLWFLNTRLVIPAPRMQAANWVFQFSVLTFVINLISVPYNACIIAHERMSAFAYISILEAVGKLFVAYLITRTSVDRLILYAGLLCVIAVLVRIVYGWYCTRHFQECHYHFHWDAQLLKQMFSFSGWNFIGSASAILRDQGGNICINLFFGPAVNAARGIAFQVNHVILGFVQNFMTALNPQITKSYASGRNDYMMSLLFLGARFSFYILLLLALPVIVSTHYILVIWLKMVPEHTVSFIQLTLLFALSEALSQPLVTAMLATGRIRDYQLIVGGLQMLNLPISYLLLRLGCAPESVFITAVALSQCCLAARLIMLRGMIGLPVRGYLRRVYLNTLLVAILSALIPLAVRQGLTENPLNFIWLTLLSLACTALAILFAGCSPGERLQVRAYALKAYNRLLKR